ncbi:MAG: hypothetical protein ACNS60_12060 [Candidatus Cyclobacteriaceae bacterium M2_1C_046]
MNRDSVKITSIDNYLEFKQIESSNDYYSLLSEMLLLYGDKFQIPVSVSGIGEFHVVRLAIDIINITDNNPTLRTQIMMYIVNSHLRNCSIPYSILYALFVEYFKLIPNKSNRIKYLQNTKRNIYLSLSEFFTKRLLQKNLINFQINFNEIFAKPIIDESFLGLISRNLIQYKVSLSEFIEIENNDHLIY